MPQPRQPFDPNTLVRLIIAILRFLEALLRWDGSI
jgi:hypothetical protein